MSSEAGENEVKGTDTGKIDESATESTKLEEPETQGSLVQPPATDEKTHPPETVVQPPLQTEDNQQNSLQPARTKQGKDSKDGSPEREEGQDGESKKDKEGEDKDKKKSTKAANTTKDKLKYLEEKYKEVYKENNLRKDELNKLVGVAREMVYQIGVKNHETGEYKAEETAWIKRHWSEAWTNLKNKQEREKTRFEEETTLKVKSLTEALNKALADSTVVKETAVKEAKASMDKTIKNLEDLNNKVQRDNNNLLAAIKNKDQEVLDLKSQVLNLSNRATDSLMTRFDQLQENDITSKLQQSSRVDELIKLRNQLDESHLKIEALEEQIVKLKTHQSTSGTEAPNDPKHSSANSSQEGQPAESTPKFRFIKSKQPQDKTDQSTQTAVQNLLSNLGSPQPPYERLEVKLERERLTTKRREEEEEGSKVYLKNLIIKFMVYEAKKNEAECSVLRRAILDVLKVDSTERATIDDAVNNRGGLKDSLYFLRMLGGGQN